MKRIAFVIVTVLIMWTGASVALADVVPASPVQSADWRGTVSILAMAIGGLGVFLTGAAKLLAQIASHTKTRIDDDAAALLGKIGDSLGLVHEKLDDVIKVTSGPQAVQRMPQSGRVSLIMLALLALAAVSITAIETSGCATVQRGGSAIIDCMKTSDATRIATVEAELKNLTSWSDRYAHAAAYGAVIGGCALLHVISSAPPAASFLPDDGGRATFERFRRDEAGGAQYQTSVGVQ